MSSNSKQMIEKQLQDNEKKLGRFLKILRIHHGLSQKTLANVMNVSFQQVQKYESGINKISASRIEAAAQYMGIPVSMYFHCSKMDFDNFAAYIKKYQSESKLMNLFYAMNQSEREKLVKIAKVMTQENHDLGTAS